MIDGQDRSVSWDIVDEAINAYDQWMLDDDYDATSMLHSIMARMKERRELYREIEPTALMEQ